MGVISTLKTSISNAKPLRNPVPKYTRISSYFGPRKAVKTTNGKTSSTNHQGIDMAAPTGTAIYAAAAGTVTLAGSNGGYGLCIKIKHSSQITTLYGHCSVLLVKKGASVYKGQLIAKVGSTGNSTGPHCHFGVMVNGAWKNPLDYTDLKDTSTGSGVVGELQNAVNNAKSIAEQEKKALSTSKLSNNTSTGKTINLDSIAGNTPTSVEITSVSMKETVGKQGKHTENVSGTAVTVNNGIELIIGNSKKYIPQLEGTVTLTQYRKTSPAVLRFTVLKDGIINFQEGNPVSFRYNGNNIFLGYVFKKSRKDNSLIEVTAYDQIRYLKNKDTLSYSNKTYSELLVMIANDYGLAVGSVENTTYKIPNRIEECTLIDMLGNASDETILHTGRMYVLYDDYGKLTLKDVNSMKLPLYIDEESAQDFDYTSSIDENVYNRVRAAIDNDQTGVREVYTFNDEAHESEWGILQHYENLGTEGSVTDLKAKAQALLSYYNKKNRSLKVNGCFGDIRVRGGSSVVIKLNIGDLNLSNYMLVEEVKHTWKDGEYSMDLSLSGIRGEFKA